MAFTKSTVKNLDVPGEDAWIEIRPLTWGEVREAREIAMKAALGVVKSLEGLQIPASNRRPDPLDQHDVPTLLNAAITAWSYPEAVTPEQIADLDSGTVAWLAREILGMNTRSAEEGEALAAGSTSLGSTAANGRSN